MKTVSKNLPGGKSTELFTDNALLHMRNFKERPKTTKQLFDRAACSPPGRFGCTDSWLLDIVVSIAVMRPTVSCYVLNIKEKSAASQVDIVDR